MLAWKSNTAILRSRRTAHVASALALVLTTGCGNAGESNMSFIDWSEDAVSTRFSADSSAAGADIGGPFTVPSDTGLSDAFSGDQDGAVADISADATTPLESDGTTGAVDGSASTMDGGPSNVGGDTSGTADIGPGGTQDAGATTQDSGTTGQDAGATSQDVIIVPKPTDKDGDGYTVEGGDCDDNDSAVNPGAKEICNGKDTDCTGIPDDLDKDGDGFSVCTNDCDDTDININPQAGRDCKNGKDNDCSGIIDAIEDGDKDGFAGCKDCNDYDKDVNSGAFELPADMIDNDCDGSTDELPQACDTVPLNTNTMAHYAKAIDLCTAAGSTVLSSTFTKQAAMNSRAIKTTYGSKLKPQEGNHMVVLSSGVAAAKGQSGYKAPQSGTSFTNSATYPKVKCKNSGVVYDYTEWKLKLKVPQNVKAFSFEFNFMSSEYPEWVGSKFNDKFLAILDSQKFKGNVSFDSKGSCISINNAFFTVCNKCKGGDSELSGTGYEGGVGGGTGWLTTTSPVTPGETITLRFIVFDEGDHILDSAVILDNFRWQTTSANGGVPSTVRPGG